MSTDSSSIKANSTEVSASEPGSVATNTVTAPAAKESWSAWDEVYEKKEPVESSETTKPISKNKYVSSSEDDEEDDFADTPGVPPLKKKKTNSSGAQSTVGAPLSESEPTTALSSSTVTSQPIAKQSEMIIEQQTSEEDEKYNGDDEDEDEDEYSDGETADKLGYDSAPDSIHGDEFEKIEFRDPETEIEKVSIVREDITQVQGHEAVVCAANGRLKGDGGASGAIFRCSGNASKLQKECNHVRFEMVGDQSLPAGQCALTSGYGLCSYIIHAVGPHGRQKAILQGLYQRVLDLCVRNGIRKVIFPCISTGVFGYPSELAAEDALEAVNTWLIAAKKRRVNPLFTEAKKSRQFAKKKWEDPKGLEEWREMSEYDFIQQITFCTFQKKDFLAYQQHAPEKLTFVSHTNGDDGDSAAITAGGGPSSSSSDSTTGVSQPPPASLIY